MVNSRNPFRHPSYRRWFGATTFLTVSSSTTLAVSLAVIDATGNVAVAGVVAGCLTALELVAGIVGGGLADLRSRRRLLHRAVLVLCAADVALAALLVAVTLAGVGPSWGFAVVLVALTAVAASASGVSDPALDGSLKTLITPAEYPRAVGAAHARSATLSIVGSPTSGALYGVLPALPFVLRCVCDAGFLLCLRAITVDLGPPPVPGADARKRMLPRQIITGYRESLRHLAGEAALLRVLISAPLVNLMVFTATTWAVFSLRADGMPAFQIGLVMAGFAVGGIVGSAIAPVITDHVPAGWTAILGLGFMVVAFGSFFALPHTPVPMFLMAVVCMVPSPALNGGLFGYVFARTEPGMQGRVLATFGLVGGLASVVAPVLSGAAVSAGLSTALGSSGCLVGLLGVLLLATSRAVRTMRLEGNP
ncbi:MFS transporter [Kocuria varians]